MGINVYNIASDEHCIHQREHQGIGIEPRFFSKGYSTWNEHMLVVLSVFGEYRTSTT
jgi:hypothetical protein